MRRLLFATLVVACTVDRDIPSGRLVCMTSDDCPPGLACVPFQGRGLCCRGDDCGADAAPAPVPDAAASLDAALEAIAPPDSPADAPQGSGDMADGGPGDTGGADGRVVVDAGGGDGATGTTPPAFGCPPDEALVACYTFDEDPGDQVLDGSGKRNNGVSTATHTRGVHGMGLRFGSGTQAVRVPHSASLDLVGSNATIEAWVFPATYPTTAGLDHVLSKQSAVDSNGYAFGVYRGQFGGYSGMTGQLAGNVPVGSWSHIAAVWGPDGLSLYHQGRRVGGMGRLDLAANAEVLIIGNRRPVTGYPMPLFAYFGDLDVIRIYARARTPEEICEDANRHMVGGSCN
jgi:hypothetical protein